MDDLLNEFLTETAESIDVVDIELVKLEQDPNNKEVLDNIFRLVHTIKGTCGFLGLPRLESVAHSSENVLGKFRDGELEISADAVTVVLESLDRIKSILAGLEETEEEPDGDDSDLISRLDAIASGETAPAQAHAKTAEAKADPEPEASKDEPLEQGDVDPSLGRELKPGEVSLEELERAFNEAPGPETRQTAMVPAQPKDDRTLFERIGGEDTVSVAAHLIAKRVEHDKQAGAAFAAIQPEERKAKFTGLLTALFKDDETAANNVAEVLCKDPQFNDAAFDGLVNLAKSVFEEVGLSNDDRDEACMALELVRESATRSAREDAAKVKAATTTKTAKDDTNTAEKRSSQSIRVSVDLLEDLMTLVSELVLTRNQLLQMVRDQDDSEFSVPIQRLSQTTTELQEGVMKTRMQPIGNAWAKLPRIVRDLTIELDKKIDLDMKGAETELDRQVLELIKDPLTHMVRNSADHGIETPAERLAVGKQETGTIVLNAFHEGGHIIIEISDDGRGLPVAKLRNKALEKGLATEAELSEMSDAQIQKFIFHPGFSTAHAVTSVSGRGVGMDVVRSNIEKIGGTVDMTSIEGKGTTFQIKIPLTLAIVSALIVQAKNERFAVPQISVLELVRASSNSEHRVEWINDTPVLRLRNRLLPLVHLRDAMGFEKEEEAKDDAFIIVSQVGAFTFGIIVDQVFDTEEIVVKPVAPILKDLSIYSGNTILGDGSVIMILDPNGIASMASAKVTESESEVEDLQKAQAKVLSDKESMLVFRAGTENQKAVPLSLVARLEEIDVSKIEESDGRHVVQYRGALMPVIRVDGYEALRSEGNQPVLVFTDDDYTMGLAVDEILDIVEDNLDVKLVSDRPGMVGSAVIGGKATEVVDVSYYLGKAFSDWLKSRDTVENVPPVDGSQVLLIDDSAFFRNMLKPLLSVAGYTVTVAADASEALSLREDGRHFDLIISDIDMPGMTGFELAEKIKSGGSWAETPLVALSSMASEKDFEKGRQVGFNDYVAKFDRDRLLTSLTQQLRLKDSAA